MQVNTDEWALDHLTFLKSILDPFLESYWNTAVRLLQLEHTIEGSSKHLYYISLFCLILYRTSIFEAATREPCGKGKGGGFEKWYAMYKTKQKRF